MEKNLKIRTKKGKEQKTKTGGPPPLGLEKGNGPPGPMIKEEKRWTWEPEG